MANYILSYFPDTDLRCGHDGLADLADRAKKPVEDLKVGQFLLFVNRRQSAVKILTADDVLIYLRPESKRLNFDAISLLPKYFNGTAFNYKGAVKEAILKRIGR